MLAVSLFNGEITAEAVAARAHASGAGADPNGAGVTNLVLLGQPVTAAPNQRFPLGEWGYAITLEQAVESSVADGTRNARAAVTALRVVLTAEHGGLPAGTEISRRARGGGRGDAGCAGDAAWHLHDDHATRGEAGAAGRRAAEDEEAPAEAARAACR